MNNNDNNYPMEKKMDDNFQNNQNNQMNQMPNNYNANNQNNMGNMNNNQQNNMQNNQQNNMQNNNQYNMGNNQYGSVVTCDEEGSTSNNTRNLIQTAIESVLNSGNGTAKPEDVSTALRNVGFMAFIFSGGHGFWWNFECEWSEWSFNDEAYRIVVWKPSQNK